MRVSFSVVCRGWWVTDPTRLLAPSSPLVVSQYLVTLGFMTIYTSTWLLGKWPWKTRRGYRVVFTSYSVSVVLWLQSISHRVSTLLRVVGVYGLSPGLGRPPTPLHLPEHYVDPSTRFTYVLFYWLCIPLHTIFDLLITSSFTVWLFLKVTLSSDPRLTLLVSFEVSLPSRTGPKLFIPSSLPVSLLCNLLWYIYMYTGFTTILLLYSSSDSSYPWLSY